MIEDRLGTHRVCRGLVLDQFDQPVAIDDASRRHGHIAADLELLGTRRPLATDGTLPILKKVLRTRMRFMPPCSNVHCRTSGFVSGKLEGRHHVEDLPSRE